MIQDDFVCDKCGLCCRLIGGIAPLAAFDRGDGVCSHLADGNLCDIYDTRPEVCRVKQMFRHVSARMSRAEYNDLMSRSCRFIKEHFTELQKQLKPRL